MEFIPHLLIEGMITSSFALGANLSYLHSWEYMWVYKILERAIAEESGWLLVKYIRTGYDLELYVHIVWRLYLWRRNALIESLEGKRGNPCIKPPFPAVWFMVQPYRRNVETIASVPWIVNNSGDDYAKIGIEDQLELN
jgi:NADH-quinone oxidoreductase subunit F